MRGAIRAVMETVSDADSGLARDCGESPFRQALMAEAFNFRMVANLNVPDDQRWVSY